MSGTEYGKQKKQENRSRLREITDVLKKHKLYEGLTPVKFREILEDLGPTFVKLGQIMSLHSDILPKEYCDELMKLSSDVAPIPFDQVERVLENNYEQPWQEIFSSIDEKPLGSASIAQVHRAKLLDGTDVIVKVQREGIYDIMSRDIRLIRRAARLIPPVGKVRHMVNFDMVLDELWSVTQDEMNFLKEADNMEEFTRNNADVQFVRVPRLYREYTTNQVLVMDYVGGWPVNDAVHLKEEGYDLNEIGEKLVDNFIRQVMQDGFFHADPHPGNVKICDGKIVWIDMGMMGRLTERDRKYLTQAVIGVASNDASRVEGAVLELGDFWGKPDEDALYRGIRKLLDHYGEAGFGEIDIAQVTQELMEVMKENRIGLPHGFAMLARGLTHMEGVLTEIAPELNMVDIASSRVRSMMRDSFDWRGELSREGRKLLSTSRKLVKLPDILMQMLEDYRHGGGGMKLTLSSSPRLAWLLRKLVRNIVMGLWVMALLISSSIICTTDMKPKILGIPLVGLAGYVMAFIIVLYVMIRHFIDQFK